MAGLYWKQKRGKKVALPVAAVSASGNMAAGGKVTAVTTVEAGTNVTAVANVEAGGKLIATGNLKIKVFSQAAEPDAAAIPAGECAFWIDTDDANRLYICYNQGGTIKTAELT